MDKTSNDLMSIVMIEVQKHPCSESIDNDVKPGVKIKTIYNSWIILNNLNPVVRLERVQIPCLNGSGINGGTPSKTRVSSKTRKRVSKTSRSLIKSNTATLDCNYDGTPVKTRSSPTSTDHLSKTSKPLIKTENSIPNYLNPVVTIERIESLSPLCGDDLKSVVKVEEVDHSCSERLRIKEDEGRLTSGMKKTNGAHVKAMNEDTCKLYNSQCNYKASHMRKHNRHTTTEHEGSKVFACSCCYYKTNKRRYIKRHITSVHVGSMDYACSLCDFKTDQRKFIKKHIGTVHEMRSDLTCSHCGFESVHKSIMRHHERKKGLACSVCNFRSSYKAHMKVHMVVEHGQKMKYAYFKCDFKTSLSDCLKNHDTEVYKNKRVCARCNYKRSRESHLVMNQVCQQVQDELDGSS